MGMMPPHLGAFLRVEILEKPRLNVSRAAEMLGVRRATVCDLLNPYRWHWEGGAILGDTIIQCPTGVNWRVVWAPRW